MSAHVLILPYPISANRYWASRVIRIKETGKWRSMTYVTPEAEAYKAEVGLRAKTQGLRIPFDGRVAWRIRLYPALPQDWAKRSQKNPDTWDDDVLCMDLGNCEKVLADALNGIAWLDDKQIRRTVLERMEPDKHGARVEVTVGPIKVVPICADLFAA